jgi:ribonuclease VapC
LGPIVFIDTSVFVAILTNEPDRDAFIDAIAAAEHRITSPVVRLETCIVLSRRLDFSPRDADARFDAFRTDAEIEERPIDSIVGAAAVACFEQYGKGRHPARLNFADCLSYACAKAHGATLLFKGGDFAQTDVTGR